MNNNQQQPTPTFDVENGNLLNNLLEEENDYQKNGKTRSRIPRGTLDILLKEFQINNSPNSGDRKRIAAQCNIEEKRVRIWFQNKRAKLKKLQNRNTYDPNYEIFEDKFEIEPLFDNVPWGLNHNYHFIDSSSVSVGGWKRLKNGHLSKEDENGVEIDNSHVMELVTNLSNLSPRSIDSIMGDATDLLLIISKKNNEINYFFSAIADDRRILFRVFFPIYTVVNCSISVSKERPDTGMESDDDDNNNLNTPDKSDKNEEELSQLSLMLNKPPKFAVYFTDGDENDDNQWNICDDFSEDKQVSMSFMGSYEIPHIITGLEDSLKKMNSLILEYNSKFGGIYHVPPQ
ncbi:homeobox-domain-containing protein, partial [Hanseniaspora valbyensis NRRL Y-1626]